MGRMTNEKFQEKLRHLQATLEPLYQLPEGGPHPEFPCSLLQYHLLTEDQLNSMAHFYHQVELCEYTSEYPEYMGWDEDYFQTLESVERVAIKRRKFGKFIGLRGCQTPTEELAKRIELLGKRSEEAAQKATEQEEAVRKAYYRRWEPR